MDAWQRIVAQFDRYLASRKADLSSGDVRAGGGATPAAVGSIVVEPARGKKKPKADGFEGALGVVKRIAPLRKLRAKKAEFAGLPIVIDRPKGYVQEGKDAQGKAWRRVYRYDYGFIPKTEGGDGEGVDVFLGPSPAASTSWWAVQIKADGTFDEFKICLGFQSEALAKGCYALHIPPRFCAEWVPVPVPFIKSLLGLEPRAVIKALRKAAMRNRTKKIDGVSFETLNAAISEALSTAYPPAADASGACSPCGPWPTEVYDDAVVYTREGQLFKESFSFSAGVATLGGNPIRVQRTYVPIDQGTAPPAGEVTMSTTKNAGVKKAGPTAGGADIVSLAAERLALVAGELGKGDGMITPEANAEINAVIALLETAGQLYSGGAPSEDDLEEGAGGDGAGDPSLEMADLADAEKRGGVVKMTDAQFIAYTTGQLAKARAESDPVKKATRLGRLEVTVAHAMRAAKAEGAAEGGGIPVQIMPEEDPEGTSTAGAPLIPPAPAAGTAPPAVVAGVGSPVAGAAATEKSANDKIASVSASIAKLRGGKVTKNEGEGAAAAGAPVEDEIFPQAYQDALPDTAFLYVEASATKGADGATIPAVRHFAVKDKDGNVSRAMVAHALKSIPAWGATQALKTDLLKQAQNLASFAADLAKSATEAGDRGDDGWAEDMAAPTSKARAKETATFGFDGLAGKVKAATDAAGT